MKILLVQPPVRDFYHTGHRMYPLGLLYLASSLKRAGFSCQVLDAFRVEQKRALPIPQSMGYLREYYSGEDKSPFRLFGSFQHFGLTDVEIREKIKDQDADLVAISSLFTPYEEEALTVARIAKKLGKLTVLGGNHATVASMHLMEDAAVDYVICGEGEKRLVALAEAICGHRSFESIDGLAFRVRGTVRLSSPKGLLTDLDDLPFPDRALLDPDRYRFQGSRYTMMLSSRGCPFQCRFCSGHAVMGNKVRFRSIDSILAEMRLCYDSEQIRVFDFEDEHFTCHKDRTIQLLEAIEAEFGHDETLHGRSSPLPLSPSKMGTDLKSVPISEGEGRSFRLLFENGLFPHSLDREILDRLQRLGCRHLNLPLVSSSARTLKRLNRPGDTLSFSRIVSEAGAGGVRGSEAGASEAGAGGVRGSGAGVSGVGVSNAEASGAGMSEAGVSEAGVSGAAGGIGAGTSETEASWAGSGGARASGGGASAAGTIGAGTIGVGANEVRGGRAGASAAGNNFFITGYLILGLPDSDLEEMVESIRFLAGQRVLIAPSIFYATPGMDLYAEGLKNGWLPVAGGLSALRSSAFPIETDRFSRLDLVTLFRLIRALNFIKSLIDERGEAGNNEVEDDEGGDDEAGDAEAGNDEAGDVGEAKEKRETEKTGGSGGLGESGKSGEWGESGKIGTSGMSGTPMLRETGSPMLKGEMKLSEFLQALIADFRAATSDSPSQDHPLSTAEGAISSSRPLSQRELGLWLLSQWLGAGPPAFHRIQRERQGRQGTEGRHGTGRGQRQGASVQWTYRMARQADSARVWEIFLDLMGQAPIRGIKNPLLSLIWDISI